MKIEQWSERLRGLALVGMFLVVCIHCTSSFKATNGYLWAFGYDGFFRVAVPFFFLVSGAFLGRHVDEAGWWRREALKRCRSLVVPYFVWLALFFVFRTTLLKIVGVPVDLSWNALAVDFGLNPLEYPGLRPLWYVRALFGLVLISPIFVWLARRVCGWLFLLALPFGDWTFFPLGIAFGMGVIDLELTRPRAAVILGVGCVVMAVGAFCSGTGWGWSGLCSLALPFLVIGGVNLAPDVEVPREVAGTAFPIYLMHMFVVSSIGLLIRNQGWQGGWLEVPVVVGGAVISYVAAMCVALVLRRKSPAFNGILWGGR